MVVTIAWEGLGSAIDQILLLVTITILALVADFVLGLPRFQKIGDATVTYALVGSRRLLPIGGILMISISLAGVIRSFLIGTSIPFVYGYALAFYYAFIIVSPISLTIIHYVPLLFDKLDATVAAHYARRIMAVGNEGLRCIVCGKVLQTGAVAVETLALGPGQPGRKCWHVKCPTMDFDTLYFIDHYQRKGYKRIGLDVMLMLYLATLALVSVVSLYIIYSSVQTGRVFSWSLALGITALSVGTYLFGGNAVSAIRVRPSRPTISPMRQGSIDWEDIHLIPRGVFLKIERYAKLASGNVHNGELVGHTSNALIVTEPALPIPFGENVISPTVVFVDGLCEPVNPGGFATFGLVVEDGAGKVLVKKSGFVGKGPEMSNNVAEYAALCEALRFLIQEGMARRLIEVRSDSRLVVNQMKGEWKFRKGLYAQQYREAKDLVGRFDKISFRWIPREDNVQADALSREAYSNGTAISG